MIMIHRKSAILIILAVVLSACYQSKGFKHIGIIKWSEGLKGYQNAHKGILDGLRDNGYREGRNIEIEYRNMDKSEAEGKKIVEDFVRKRYDLIICIGSAACFIAKDGTRESRIPIVFSSLMLPRETGLINGSQYSGNNLTGIAGEIPARLYFEKIKKILPNSKNIGIVYTDTYRTGVIAAGQAKETAPEFGLVPHMIKLETADLGRIDEVIKALPVKMDAVYIVSDFVLYEDSVIKRLIYAFRKAGIPSALITENFLKYGALFALNRDYYMVGRQTVSYILKVLDGVRPEDIPIEKPYTVRFTINKETADALGIDLKWNVIREANSIVE